MKTVHNKKGAILVFVLIINAIMIITSTILLSTVMMDYKMKKVNSEVKKALYYAEAGLDESYAITLEFLSSALNFFSENGQENESEEKNLNKRFSDIINGKSTEYGNRKSLKSILENKNNYIICNGDYPLINVESKEKSDGFTLKITSTYKKGKIEKKVSLSYKIILPGNEAEVDTITAESLIKDTNWNIER